MRIAYVDTETTGTQSHHVAWEVAVVVEQDWQVVEECVWTLRLDAFEVDRAEPRALEVGRFFERYNAATLFEPLGVANALSHVLDKDTRLASCNVAFDDRFLARLIATKGQKLANPRPWHYSPIDVKSACYGHDPSLLGAKTQDLMDAAGVVVDEDGIRHSALTDARIARRLLHWALGRMTLPGGARLGHRS